jgi:hypothetical protein
VPDLLTLNDIPIPVAADSFGEDAPQVIGEDVRAFDGSLRSTEIAVKRVWRGRTTPKLQLEREALRRLIRGEGDHFVFDADLYSDKGLLATYGGSAPTIVGSPAPKYGAGCVSVPNGSTLQVAGVIPSTAPLGWAVAVWRYNGASWDHYLVTSAGEKWVNGARNDAASTTWLGVASGTLSLSGDGAIRYYDDLVVLPFRIPTSWASIIYGAGHAWPTMPRLAAAGVGVPGGATVRGRLREGRQLQGDPGTGFTQDLGVVDFELLEA